MRIIVAFVAASLLAAADPAAAGDLVVKVSGVKARGGKVLAALYDRDPLYRTAPARSGEASAAATGDTVILFRNVPPGEYVVSAFHDADGDGRLGTAGGKLSEGTAISNAEKLRGAPSFAVNKVAVGPGGTSVTIAMSYPEDRQGW